MTNHLHPAGHGGTPAPKAPSPTPQKSPPSPPASYSSPAGDPAFLDNYTASLTNGLRLNYRLPPRQIERDITMADLAGRLQRLVPKGSVRLDSTGNSLLLSIDRRFDLGFWDRWITFNWLGRTAEATIRRAAHDPQQLAVDISHTPYYGWLLIIPVVLVVEVWGTFLAIPAMRRHVGRVIDNALA